MCWFGNLRESINQHVDPACRAHVCDRAGDIRQLICLAKDLDAHLAIRRCANRFVAGGFETVASIIASRDAGQS